MSGELTAIDEFVYDTVWQEPSKTFESVEDADHFVAQLTQLEISFRIRLVVPRKRLKQPMQTIVTLLDTADGVRH